MRIHLIRHGEVDNPGNVVYADIPGFSLSARGRGQATAAGEYLAHGTLSLIVSSPLDRAVETAAGIGAITRAPVVTDARLTEWSLAVRWRGAVWDRLPEVFPGELEAYFATPYHLPFCPESLGQVTERIHAAVAEWSVRDGEVAFVSHEDPLHATHLRLTGIEPTTYHADKPTHGSVTTLGRAGDVWATVARWAPPPPQG